MIGLSPTRELKMTKDRVSNRLFYGLQLVGLLLLLSWRQSFSAEDYSNWAHHQDIYFDTSPGGANTAGDVMDFPVLVRLRAADFPFAQAQGKGQDLRFAKPDGTRFPFEIERYDSSAHVAEIWVKVDTVKANFKGIFARMYWGGDTTHASSPGDLFSGTNGYSNVWHLGGVNPAPRLSAVTGSSDAVPQNYDSDENTEGIIGWADSLDGGAPGDHLQTLEPFDSLNKGFTFSVWAYPTAVTLWARFMDFGNGNGLDNLIFSRGAMSDDIVFQSYNNSSKSELLVSGAIALNQWQYFAVTVAGKTAKIYRNGSLVGSGDLIDTLSGAPRANNYLGKSNWATDGYFMGKLDEPIVAKAVRNSDWIKLCYANQKTDQNLVSFIVPITCTSVFSAPGDTSAPEGSTLSLNGKADCADAYSWSVESGPGGRILDPEVKTLQVAIPRITKDTLVVYRFNARYGDSTRSQLVKVNVKETIPDPVFTLPANLTWDGKDSLTIQPIISNLAAVKASAQAALKYAWTLSGPDVDTSLQSDRLILKSPTDNGVLTLSLCLDNNGPPTCQSMGITMEVPVATRRRADKYDGKSLPKSYDARGRRFPGRSFQWGGLFSHP